jgi:hypothetical protein
MEGAAKTERASEPRSKRRARVEKRWTAIWKARGGGSTTDPGRLTTRFYAPPVHWMNVTPAGSCPVNRLGALSTSASASRFGRRNPRVGVLCSHAISQCPRLGMVWSVVQKSTGEQATEASFQRVGHPLESTPVPIASRSSKRACELPAALRTSGMIDLASEKSHPSIMNASRGAKRKRGPQIKAGTSLGSSFRKLSLRISSGSAHPRTNAPR